MSDLTLAEFLAARYDEREALAHRVQAALDAGWNYFDEVPTELIDPARVLREAGAGRKILELHLPGEPDDYGRIRCQRCDESGYPCSTLRALGSVFSDHPAYREDLA